MLHKIQTCVTTITMIGVWTNLALNYYMFKTLPETKYTHK